MRSAGWTRQISKFKNRGPEFRLAAGKTQAMVYDYMDTIGVLKMWLGQESRFMVLMDKYFIKFDRETKYPAP